MEDEFLTVDEVAQLLKLNPQTVRNTIDRGDLPAVRFGRRVRIRRADLNSYLAAGSRSSPARLEFENTAHAALAAVRHGTPDAVDVLRSLAAAAITVADELDADG